MILLLFVFALHEIFVSYFTLLFSGDSSGDLSAVLTSHQHESARTTSLQGQGGYSQETLL